MYDDELRNVTREEIEKQAALMIHTTACRETGIFNLPYRILIDYYEAEQDDDIVPLNLYYPLNGVPKAGEWQFNTDGNYTPREWIKIITTPTGEYTDDGKPYVTWRIPPQIQALIDEKGKPYRLWDLETAAGLQAWAYYFMVFIMPYEDDIPHYSVFDMYGSVNHSEQDLNERKQYYMDLIARCKEQPELYKHDIQTYKHPLDILYYERDMIPNYKKACKDTSNRAYRIEQIINLLEQDSPKLDAQEA